MTWTANKRDKGFTGGQVFVQVWYDDGASGGFAESYRADTIVADWPDAIIRGKLDRLNGLDLTTIPLGPPLPKPVDKLPTQDELDLRAFLVLIQNYKEAAGEVAAKIGKTTQEDVDAIYVQIKETYKDEYAPYLVGLL